MCTSNIIEIQNLALQIWDSEFEKSRISRYLNLITVNIDVIKSLFPPIKKTSKQADICQGFAHPSRNKEMRYSKMG